MTDLHDTIQAMSPDQLRVALEDAMRRETATPEIHEHSYQAMLTASPKEARRIMRKTIHPFVYVFGFMIGMPLVSGLLIIFYAAVT